MEGSSAAFLEDFIIDSEQQQDYFNQQQANTVTIFMNNYPSSVDRMVVSHVVPVSGVGSSFTGPMNLHADFYHHYNVSVEKKNASLILIIFFFFFIICGVGMVIFKVDGVDAANSLLHWFSV